MLQEWDLCVQQLKEELCLCVFHNSFVQKVIKALNVQIRRNVNMQFSRCRKYKN